LPSSLAKPDVLSFQCPFLKPSLSAESMETQNKWFDDNQFVNVNSSAQWPVSVDAQGMFDLTILSLIFL